MVPIRQIGTMAAITAHLGGKRREQPMTPGHIEADGFRSPYLPLRFLWNEMRPLLLQ